MKPLKGIENTLMLGAVDRGSESSFVEGSSSSPSVCPSDERYGKSTDNVGDGLNPFPFLLVVT